MRDAELRALQRTDGEDYDADHLQLIRCRAGDHQFERSEDPSEHCGCPSDPGIHMCHPMLCIHCGEEDY